MGSVKSDPVSNSGKNNGNPYGKVVLTLINQLLPDEKLSPTPSQLDGLGLDTETDLRIYGCELIQTAGILLKLPQVAMATGQVLLQRFYYSKSLVRHPVEHTAMACVCLASKIEEAPRRVRDVINVFTHVRQVNSNKYLQYHELNSEIGLDKHCLNLEIIMIWTYWDPCEPILRCHQVAAFFIEEIQPVILDQSYIQLKNLIIKAERRILKELGFCVHIKHPHKIIVMFLQVLGLNNHQKLMQYSWNYMNDSLRTDVFVRYQPETVACACIYLTARKLKLPLPKNPAWFSIFGSTEEQIRDISVRILKLYSRPKANIESLEKKVEDLCEKYKSARVKVRNSGNNTPNNDSSPSQQKTTGAHNAWGGFISRSGSHIAPPIEKRSRSRSATHSPEKHKKRSKKHRSRSRSVTRNHKKNHKRKSYSRSRSNTPPAKVKKRERRSSRSPSIDRESRNDRHIDRYEKYEKERYKDERERYSSKDKYDDKKDRKEKYDTKHRDKEDKYSREDRDRYNKKSKHRDEEKERSKDRR